MGGSVIMMMLQLAAASAAASAFTLATKASSVKAVPGGSPLTLMEYLRCCTKQPHSELPGAISGYAHVIA